MIRMKVKLLAYTPDPEKLVAAAAKNCYSSTDVDSVLDGLTEEKTESFVNMLSEIGHESPIEPMCRSPLQSRVYRVLCWRRSRATALHRSRYRASAMCVRRVRVCCSAGD